MEDRFSASMWKAWCDITRGLKCDQPQEPVVALVDHGSEINLMSMEFYKKGKWPINTKHGWKICAATRATEELHGACPNVQVKINDVEIDQHFFV